MSSWRSLIRREDSFEKIGREWFFRGEPSLSHPMQPSLHRALKDYSIPQDDWHDIENKLIQDFRRSCHLHAPPYLPDDLDTIARLALMRHYGAPTRLVDFTFFFFIAAFFSLERNPETFVVWAICKSWLTHHAETKIKSLPCGCKKWEAWGRRDGAVFKELMLCPTPPQTAAGDQVVLVHACAPGKMNDRLTIQQGSFLCANVLTRPTLHLLNAMPDAEDNVKRLVIRKDARKDILAKLHRAGVNRALLFPGLQGFAESLRTSIVWKEKLKLLQETGARSSPQDNPVTG